MILVYKNNENTIELRHTLHKVINKEYKICDSSMQFDRNNNLILNLTLDIPNKESKGYLEGRTLGVDLGIKYPAYVCLLDDIYKRKSKGCAEDFIRVREQIRGRFSILEYGSWIYTRRCKKRFRRYANYAYFRTQYGMVT